MSSSSAARTNLSSRAVFIQDDVIGTGQFRIARSATYIGGNRNQQAAVAKCFKAKFAALETEFFSADFLVADKAIQYAEDWNAMCEKGKEILVTKGDVMRNGTKTFLVEPLIRYFHKYTSNNGWISNESGWQILVMEAFSHYTYHRSGGMMIVCDLQGRYRFDKYSGNKSRFELTDPAICSRNRHYGPTDLGEKGIDSFFAHHKCNRFCHFDGRWQRPRAAKEWFHPNSATSMLQSTATNLLSLNNRKRFNSSLCPIEDSGESDSDDDSW